MLTLSSTGETGNSPTGLMASWLEKPQRPFSIVSCVSQIAFAKETQPSCVAHPLEKQHSCFSMDPKGGRTRCMPPHLLEKQFACSLYPRQLRDTTSPTRMLPGASSATPANPNGSRPVRVCVAIDNIAHKRVWSGRPTAELEVFQRGHFPNISYDRLFTDHFPGFRICIWSYRNSSHRSNQSGGRC